MLYILIDEFEHRRERILVRHGVEIQCATDEIARTVSKIKLDIGCSISAYFVQKPVNIFLCVAVWRLADSIGLDGMLVHEVVRIGHKTVKIVV